MRRIPGPDPAVQEHTIGLVVGVRDARQRQNRENDDSVQWHVPST
jgi:hypothetical protein